MSEGFTGSENYLLTLARKSFLNLWSWPNLFRDQKAKGGRDGKELCDLLVVFGNDVIVFSDKLCEFPDTGDAKLDWARWYKRAIHKSATQAIGAKRWLESYSERVFVDSACSTKLPINIPKGDVRFHLVVVAHGSGARCSNYFNDSASLMINTRITGESHFLPLEQVEPFCIGVVNESGPFVHVLDDSSLDTLLEYLDTTGDFVEYLSARERFLSSRRVVAVGEEELLGFYLSKMENGKRDFFVPKDVNLVMIDRGHWYDFITSESYRAKRQADRISYTWDALVNTITDSVLNGRSYFPTDRTVDEEEQCLRILASERRTWRRALAESLLAIVQRANQQKLSVRVIAEDKTSDGSTAYVFLALLFPCGIELERYRESRLAWLRKYCMVAKLLLPKAKRIVGIATEHRAFTGNRSEDLILLNLDQWTDEDELDALRLQQEECILKETAKSGGTYKEFPVDEMKKQARKSRSNRLCPCGSGKKYKKCHGK